jgi:membrane-associated phospholipid phosphatase
LPKPPSYPSNHACDSGAAAEVLALLFPAEAERLRAARRRGGESRIDAGIHYRFDLDAGLAIGRAAARAALGTDGSQQVVEAGR